LDPDYEVWLDDERGRVEERLARKKARRLSMLDGSRAVRQAPPAKPVELLPSPPAAAPLRMESDVEMAEVLDEAGVPVLSIRGAAKVEPTPTPARLSLLERLAKAKAEAAGAPTNGTPLTPISANDLPTLPGITSDEALSPGTALKSPGVQAIVQARLKLRLKLASEKKVFVYNQNESKAQELRRVLLEARARREAEETDTVLRKMDKDDRAREVRRRLMVEKMLAAETESERRARELKEKLLGERRAKILKETLRKRKVSQGQEASVPAISVR